MTVWQNLKINSTPHSVKRMHEMGRMLITPFFHLSAFLKQFIAHKPPEFIKIHIQQNTVTLFHIKNRHILDRLESSISQIKTSQAPSFLARLSTLPLQILIDDETVNYRLISLTKTNYWNRYGLFNQIRLAEFDSTDWIYNEHVPSPSDKYRYVFIGFKPSALILEMFTYLNNLQNPIARIQLTSVQQTAAALTRITEHESVRNFCPWSLFVRKVSDTEWLLSAQQYGAIVLSRRGTFATNSTEEKTIEDEITTTRNGYEDGEHVTLITAGFSDEFNKYSFNSISVANVLSVPVRDIDVRIQLGSHADEFSTRGFWILNQFRSILKRPQSLYCKGFNPRAMLNQRLAYWIPFMCYRLIIPISAVCFLVLLTCASKTQHLNHELKTTLFKKEAMLTTTGDEKRRQAAENFDVFKDLIGENPLLFLKNLSVSLTKEMRISQFSWNSSKIENHSKTSFEATITLQNGSPLAKRKTKNNKTLSSHQQRVQKRLQKYYPSAAIVWLPIPGKEAYTLGVSWD